MDGMEAVVDSVETQDVAADQDVSATQDVAVEAPETGGSTPDVDAKGGDQAGDDADSSPDGRRLPNDVKAALKALRELSPANGKVVDSLRKAFFSTQQYTQAFPTPAQAQTAKAALDLVGGSAGIAEIQAKLAQVEEVDASFEQGNTEVIDDIVQDFPDGFKKLVPYALEKLSQLDPKAYATTLQSHLFSQLEQAGLGEVLGGILDALGTNNVEGAKKAVADIQKWYGAQKQLAGQKTAQPDPERQKFESERQKFNQEKETTFRQSIGSQTVAHQSSQILKELSPYLRGKSLGDDAKKDLADGIQREISSLLQGNTAYQTQVKALLSAKTRDQSKIVAYINAAVDEATPKAVKAVWSRRYGAVPVAKAVQSGAKPAVAPPTGMGSAPMSPIQIKIKPNREDMDLSKDPNRQLLVTSRAFMKSGPYKGRWVRWA